MRHEAKIEETEVGRVPVDDGWYILNLSEIRWATVPGGGTWCGFGSPNHPSDRIGIGVHILWPGDAPGFYHEESDLEGFLVLSGECIAIVEEQERRLRRFDLLHCPPWTKHVLVGAGDGPCVVLMVGARVEDGIVYAVSELAARYGASVAEETGSPHEAYASYEHWAPAKEKPEL